MHYLARVWKTLKKVTWERLSTSLKHMVIVAVTVVITACTYWLLDMLITGLIQHL